MSPDEREEVLSKSCPIFPQYDSDDHYHDHDHEEDDDNIDNDDMYNDKYHNDENDECKMINLQDDTSIPSQQPVSPPFPLLI